MRERERERERERKEEREKKKERERESEALLIKETKVTMQRELIGGSQKVIFSFI